MNLLNSSHFKNTIWLTVLSVATVIALSDVNRNCMARNNGTIPNDFLLGVWYKIYNFIPFGTYPTCSCPNTTFTRPTQEELTEYREKYSSVDLPHAIGDDSVFVNIHYYKGLLLGGGEAKTFIINPIHMPKHLEKYDVFVYRRISDKYMLFWECKFRGHMKWLLSRDPDVSDEEIQQVIRDRPEIIYKNNGLRFCKDNCYS